MSSGSWETRGVDAAALTQWREPHKINPCLDARGYNRQILHLGQSALDCRGVLIDLSAGHIIRNARCQIMDGVDPVAKLAI